MVELFGNVIPTTPAVNPLFVNTDDYQQRPWDCAYWTAELVTPCLYAYSIDGVDQLDGLEYYELFDHLRGVVERHDGRTMPALTVYEYGRKESYANAIETELCKLGAIAVYDDNERQLFGYPYVEVSDGEFSPYSGNLDEWTSDDDNNGCRAIVVATSNNGIAPNGWRGVPFCCVNDGGTLRRVELPNGWHY